jgi:signal transduction histidine kinase
MGKASEVGRQAIADMQHVLGVLRAPNENGAGRPDLEPQPGLARLDTLLSEVRAAGLPVELVVGGAPPELGSGAELALYRVVQEALTNTRKHAGDGASARVRLHFDARGVEVTVVDDGPARRAVSPGDQLGGHGIAGMRERVLVHGGELEAGPLRSGQGWRVFARIPVQEGRS